VVILIRTRLLVNQAREFFDASNQLVIQPFQLLAFLLQFANFNDQLLHSCFFFCAEHVYLFAYDSASHLFFHLLYTLLFFEQFKLL
jgi:hypothetical protein